MIYRSASQDASTAITPFSAGVDVHLEMERCVSWNEQERVSEVEELIYEVSWIPELGAWRRFLRSRQKLQN